MKRMQGIFLNVGRSAWCRARCALAAGFIYLLVPPAIWAQVELARELANENDFAGAALEFRRLALDAEPPAKGGFLWAAAYAYCRAGDLERAEKLVGEAENAAPTLSVSALLLRGELAAADQRWSESAFYFEGAAAAAPQLEAKRYAVRKAAAAKVREGAPSDALNVLSNSPEAETNAVAALQAYQEGRDRSPALGGTLGLIPGMGYLYAGEPANALRSLILNSIFIFGMVHTAQEEQWGAFAVITFFEFTWYSGSIYGGIDASHRYNRKRMDACVKGAVGGAYFEPDYNVLPTVSLRFTF
jgi:tetratricopeptide (TPR) repeat protein